MVLPSHIPSLRQFMLRRDVMVLYRDMFRTIREVNDSYYREYLRDWVRTEFKNHIKETDEREIQLLVAQGRKRLQEFQTSMDNAFYRT
ncbi:hypothetical protein PTSG_01219 [Salpingoeca rosetta]|uniref:LYR motif-containing protein 2 n=1 Tax=Salpingoeca rosetta (strain ATCC 50818 / BSB-021) TaxID=946362 RepID=F2U157_SALR5|nr:uncharacterized protein PTSG_01219 [Salpingoeca rosetta]EGD80631.1 hypothetical protein PTSG_01219 [Salpingoeca rosetta]|eukprot:XP_004997192.1 hypothetical protein PTSG_01219 [Salpingoeca rosetta]